MPKHHSLSPLRQVALALALVTALAVAFAGSAHADPVRIVTLRADSATGVTHYPSPGLGTPWVNLSGGPNADLENFHGNLVSGWIGKGTHSSPWRLYWGDGKQRGVFPAGSIAALQDSTAPVTAELWFKTGFNGPRPEPAYLLEWNQAPIAGAGSEYQSRGMSIAIQDGQLKVYQNDWVSGGAVAPNTWHHVAVVKAPNDLRIYLDGQRTYTGNHPLMGAQTSPLAIGCSVYHYYDPNAGGVSYGDYFNGSIAQVKVWAGALNDASVLASFQADSALYLPNDPEPALKQLVSLRADHSNGAGRYPIPGNAGPWVDLSGNGHPATLIGFAGTDSMSGWSGQGTVGSPYRLAYDGATNYAVIPAGSIPEMQEPTTTTTQLWFKTGRHADSDTARSLVQWLAGITSVSGMSLETGSGVIRIFRSGVGAGWTPMAPVSNNRWYQVTVVKKAGEMRVFLNGATVFSTTRPTVGAQGTDLVIGGDTWRGDGVYGEPIDGAIGQFTQWQGAMDDAAVRASFLADSALYLTQPKIITASAGANGTISPSGAVPVYVETDQAFTITADLCHVIADVVGDGVSKGPVSTYTFTNVLANHTIAATFGIFTPVITALAGPNGTISPAGAVATTCGGTMQFTPAANTGYHVATVMVDGAAVTLDASYSFTNVTTNHTIQVAFAADGPLPLAKVVEFRADSASGFGPYASPSATGPWKDMTHNYNASLVNFDATPASGWNGDGSSSSPYRLEFSTGMEAVVLPPGSVAALQSPTAVTVAMWFRTPSTPDTSRDYYLLDWRANDGVSGMSLMIHNNRVWVNVGSWAKFGTMTPGTWHHIVVTKTATLVKGWVDADFRLSYPTSLLGGQQSSLAIGASVRLGPTTLSDVYSGAIAQVSVFQGAAADPDVQWLYSRDAMRFQASTLAVGGGADARLQLIGCTPNPARGHLRVTFSLPDARPARLELIDVAGRRIGGAELTSLGVGLHSIDLARGGMPAPGLYWVRLVHGEESRVTRVAVVQ